MSRRKEPYFVDILSVFHSLVGFDFAHFYSLEQLWHCELVQCGGQELLTDVAFSIVYAR